MNKDIDVFISHEDLIILSTEYKEEYNESLKHITVIHNNKQNDVPVYTFGLYPEDYQPSGYYNYSYALYPEQHQPSGYSNINISSDAYTYNFVLSPRDVQPSGSVNMPINMSTMMDFYETFNT